MWVPIALFQLGVEGAGGARRILGAEWALAGHRRLPPGHPCRTYNNLQTADMMPAPAGLPGGMADEEIGGPSTAAVPRCVWGGKGGEIPLYSATSSGWGVWQGVFRSSPSILDIPHPPKRELPLLQALSFWSPPHRPPLFSWGSPYLEGKGGEGCHSTLGQA
jgi:hypothetical protein